MIKILLALTLVPLVELIALSFLWTFIGPPRTLALVLLTGLVGASLARREGLGVLFELQRDLAEGRSPADRLVEGALVVAGGLLLLTPGVFTDLVGFGMMFRRTRAWLAPQILRFLARHIRVASTSHGSKGHPPTPERDDHPFSSPFDDLL